MQNNFKILFAAVSPVLLGLTETQTAIINELSETARSWGDTFFDNIDAVKARIENNLKYINVTHDEQILLDTTATSISFFFTEIKTSPALIISFNKYTIEQEAQEALDLVKEATKLAADFKRFSVSVSRYGMSPKALLIIAEKLELEITGQANRDHDGVFYSVANRGAVLQGLEIGFHCSSINAKLEPIVPPITELLKM